MEHLFISLFISLPSSPSCRPLTLWPGCFLAKQNDQKTAWPPLDFSSLSHFYLDFTFRDILYLKILYYNIQWLGKSTKGSVWSLPPSPSLPAPLHCMSVWITECLRLLPWLFSQFCVSVSVFKTLNTSSDLSSSCNASFQQHKLCCFQLLGQFVGFVCKCFIFMVFRIFVDLSEFTRC